MKRFFGFVACLTLVFSVSLSASPLPAPMLLLQNDVVCPDDAVLHKVEARSETFECCNQGARFDAAASAAKNVVDRISTICRNDGCDKSAIARICISYERVTNDGKCVAIATAWYACCCCIVRNPVVGDCEIDQLVCSEHSVQRIAKSERYECCDATARWNAIYDTMKAAYVDAEHKCSLLDCLGDLYIRGFKVDFRPVTNDGICAVTSTIFFSCCCVCE